MTITWKVSFINMNFKVSLKKNLVLKSFSNPSYIDLFLTNNALSFQSTKTVSTGLSDFHKLILTVLKTSIVTSKPRKIKYKNYWSLIGIWKSSFHVDSCSKFDEIFLTVLNRQAPIKRKCLGLTMHHMCPER